MTEEAATPTTMPRAPEMYAVVLFGNRLREGGFSSKLMYFKLSVSYRAMARSNSRRPILALGFFGGFFLARDAITQRSGVRLRVFVLLVL